MPFVRVSNGGTKINVGDRIYHNTSNSTTKSFSVEAGKYYLIWATNSNHTVSAYTNITYSNLDLVWGVDPTDGGNYSHILIVKAKNTGTASISLSVKIFVCTVYPFI
jgi:hypothetical protein